VEDLDKIKQLCDLNDKFKAIEKESTTHVSTPENHYLAVRLDGIGMSKKYLKDNMINKEFQKIIRQAVKNTYQVLHRKSPTNAQQIFLAIVIVSDEVSFILNTQGNYYDDKLFKIVTTIASTLSSFFTKNGMHETPKKNITGSFDGRPLILKNIEEVNEYIAHRIAIYSRNSMAKAIRLKGIPEKEVYSQQNKNNFDYYQTQFEQLNLNMESINAGSLVLTPNIKNDSELKKFKNKSLNKLITFFSDSIINFENWLQETNNEEK